MPSAVRLEEAIQMVAHGGLSSRCTGHFGVRHHSSWVKYEQIMHLHWHDVIWLDWMVDGGKNWVDNQFHA